MEEDKFIKENLTVFKKYKIKKKLGEGAFGDVYLGTSIENNESVAIKVEPRKIAKPLLESEAFFLYSLRGFGIPEVLSFGRVRNYNVLIEPLLGKSLFDIFAERRRRLPLEDICLIAKQIIERIQWVHSKYIVHRDIKPDNFLIGKKDPNVIYIIDFGLSKKYKSSSTNKHIRFGFTGKLTGTVRFASANALRGGEQSRRDDIESIGYMLIYFMRAKLPWQGVNAPKKMERYLKIYKMKKNIPPEELCKGLPKEMIEYMKYAKKLEFEQDPDYNYLRSLFSSILKKLHGDPNEKLVFSWIKLTDLPNLKNPINPAMRRDSPQSRLYRKIQHSLEKERERNTSSDNDSRQHSYQQAYYQTNNMGVVDNSSKDGLPLSEAEQQKKRSKEGLNTVVANLNKTIDENIVDFENEKMKQMGSNNGDFSSLGGNIPASKKNENDISPSKDNQKQYKSNDEQNLKKDDLKCFSPQSSNKNNTNFGSNNKNSKSNNKIILNTEDNTKKITISKNLNQNINNTASGQQEQRRHHFFDKNVNKNINNLTIVNKNGNFNIAQLSQKNLNHHINVKNYNRNNQQHNFSNQLNNSKEKDKQFKGMSNKNGISEFKFDKKENMFKRENNIGSELIEKEYKKENNMEQNINQINNMNNNLNDIHINENILPNNMKQINNNNLNNIQKNDKLLHNKNNNNMNNINNIKNINNNINNVLKNDNILPFNNKQNSNNSLNKLAKYEKLLQNKNSNMNNNMNINTNNNTNNNINNNMKNNMNNLLKNENILPVNMKQNSNNNLNKIINVENNENMIPSNTNNTSEANPNNQGEGPCDNNRRKRHINIRHLNNNYGKLNTSNITPNNEQNKENSNSPDYKYKNNEDTFEVPFKNDINLNNNYKFNNNMSNNLNNFENNNYQLGDNENIVYNNIIRKKNNMSKENLMISNNKNNGVNNTEKLANNYDLNNEVYTKPFNNNDVSNSTLKEKQNNNNNNNNNNTELINKYLNYKTQGNMKLIEKRPSYNTSRTNQNKNNFNKIDSNRRPSYNANFKGPKQLRNNCLGMNENMILDAKNNVSQAKNMKGNIVRTKKLGQINVNSDLNNTMKNSTNIKINKLSGDTYNNNFNNSMKAKLITNNLNNTCNVDMRQKYNSRQNNMIYNNLDNKSNSNLNNMGIEMNADMNINPNNNDINNYKVYQNPNQNNMMVVGNYPGNYNNSMTKMNNNLGNKGNNINIISNMNTIDNMNNIANNMNSMYNMSNVNNNKNYYRPQGNNMQNKQNMQNINKMQNMQKINNMQNIQNMQNMQNLQNMQNMQNNRIMNQNESYKNYQSNMGRVAMAYQNNNQMYGYGINGVVGSSAIITSQNNNYMQF